jgi:chorismate mutase
LHGERRISGTRLDELERLLVFLQQRAGVDEIGGAKSDAADFAQDESKRQVGVTRQRREEQVLTQNIQQPTSNTEHRIF